MSTPKAIVFSLANLIAFSQINADRSVTELSGLNSFYSDYTATNNRHIQNGTSIITKFDLWSPIVLMKQAVLFCSPPDNALLHREG